MDYIYHEDNDLEDKRIAVDTALCVYLKALGFDDDQIADFDFSDFDDAINNIGDK